LVSSRYIPGITSALLWDWYWYKAGFASSYT
jgi:hypothetical protein